MELGERQIILSDAFRDYMAATQMKARAKDVYNHHWSRIAPILGHLFIEEITTSVLDGFKQKLPRSLAPRTVNHHLTLIRAVLGFMWKREKLSHVPYIPKMSVPRKNHQWYSEMERDRLLKGMFEMFPQWYLFFYLTCRLGLRRGEVYAISRGKIRHIPALLVVDEQVQVGNRSRPASLTTRKNDAAYTVKLSQDLLDAIDWHIAKGYGGEEFLFSKDGSFPIHLDSHQRPLREVQRALGLRELGHHAIGRHSVASQAATSGHSMKAIQAQLGHLSEQSTHCYAHLGSSAQLRVMEDLKPQSPPHSWRSA
ncbi:MAG: tyrosine-type recombinase/integrase [Myxococcota bacterium]|nr:tyrosine-type recombinase/integrase [Myxococcota bacterium]